MGQHTKDIKEYINNIQKRKVNGKEVSFKVVGAYRMFERKISYSMYKFNEEQAIKAFLTMDGQSTNCINSTNLINCHDCVWCDGLENKTNYDSNEPKAKYDDLVLNFK